MELVAKCDRFSRLKHSTAFPLVFTEHGAIMAANVLNSQRAIEASVYVVRAFVKMREVLATHKELVPRTGTFLELPQNRDRPGVDNVRQ